ncbi:hypothetical protein VP01_2812g3 [Puccinia sorghi]|uniref:Uncharacterized protein n=1 Tax=Puccinia sorghi TaxID=27349 RepID=A0A0L6V2F0_9BASI|nr:hypothetical protein VP01_2812g3 [Puccinia sorghi]
MINNYHQPHSKISTREPRPTNSNPPELPPPPVNKPAKPRWDVVLAPDKAPKDISSEVNPANILTTKRRVNLAILKDIDGLGDDFLDLPSGPVAFVLAEVPQTYNQTMASGDRGKWCEAIDLELEAMADLHNMGVPKEN